MHNTVKLAAPLLAAVLTASAVGASAQSYGSGTEASMTAPMTDAAKTARAKQTVRDFLEGLETKDMDRVNGVWAENAVQEMPYAPQGVGFSSTVVGRDALIAQYADWPDTAGETNFTDELVFHETGNPNMLIAEYRGLTEVVPTGRTYDQRYIGVYTFDDAGKIVRFREYFNPNVFTYAFDMGEDTRTSSGDGG